MYESVEITAENLASYDAVVITTDHSQYDIDFILEHAKAVVDTRNLTKNATKHLDKITKLGSGTRF